VTGKYMLNKYHFDCINSRSAGPSGVWSKAYTVFNCLNTGIMGLNPTWGMEVCSHFSVLCCPV